MNAFGITDKGKVRTSNQDSFRICVSPEGDYALAALCDGMGGVHGGEIASTIAADAFMQYAYLAAEDALCGVIDGIEPVLIAFLTVSVGFTLLSVMLPLLGIGIRLTLYTSPTMPKP